MKNMMRLLTGVFLASTLLMGCGKDDDNKSSSKNYLKIGDTEYELSGGFIENYGSDSGNSWYSDDSGYDGYNTDLTLYSKGLSVQTVGENDYEFIGKGHGLYFEMFSTSGNALDNDEYVFDSTEPCPVGTFDEGWYVINYDPANDAYEDEDDIVSGKVSVSKNGDEYSITIDCTSRGGAKITGFYKGTLRYFDWSVDFKSASLKSTQTKKGMLKK